MIQWRPLVHLATYIVWQTIFYGAAMAAFTYWGAASHSSLKVLGTEMGAFQVPMVAIASASFVVIWGLLFPITREPLYEIFNPKRFRYRFLPSLLEGSWLAFGLAAAWVLVGLMTIVGVFVELGGFWASLGQSLGSALLLAFWIYGEEFLFRHKFILPLRRTSAPWIGILWTAVIYTTIKSFQLDLDWQTGTSFFFASLWMGIEFERTRDFSRGAGLWAGFLIMLLPVLGMSFTSEEFHGVVLLKNTFKVNGLGPVSHGFDAWLTGGTTGPLASGSVMLLILLQVIKSFIKNRSLLTNTH